jgi:hypothetical protein
MPAQYRPSPALIAARKREIAERYRDHAKRKNQNKPLTLAAIRISELTRLFDHRYGPVLLPDSDDGVIAARVMVHHIGRLKDAARRIDSWLGTCAPWLGLASRERLIRDTQERPLRWSADRLAWKLRVTAAERTKLNLRTIGAMDISKDQRIAATKQRRREHKHARRRATGTKPRAIYEATSLTRASMGRSRHLPRQVVQARQARETSLTLTYLSLSIWEPHLSHARGALPVSPVWRHLHACPTPAPATSTKPSSSAIAPSLATDPLPARSQDASAELSTPWSGKVHVETMPQHKPEWQFTVSAKR